MEVEMSKHTNYGSFYKRDEKREEVQTPVETQAAVQEEEPKVEEVKPELPKPVKKFATVTGGKPCKMRFKPDKKAQIINIIPFKAKVTILDEAGEWWKCSYKGITGYMMSQFLKKE
jgi:hypothetical protein